MLFKSPTCVPCAQFLPTFEEWGRGQDEHDVLVIDAADSMDTFRQYRVASVPTVIVEDENGPRKIPSTRAALEDI